MTVSVNISPVRDSSLVVDYAPGDARSFDPRENLIQYSEQFDNAYWVKSNCVVTSNAGMAPNGTITADAMTESTDASVQFHNVATGSVTLTAGNYYTMSVYVKGAGNFNTAFNGVELAGLAGGANFNLNTRNINFNFGTTTASSITDVGNGWYYITVTCLIATTTTYTMFVQLSTAIGNTNYQGTGALRLYVWGAQLEKGTVATPLTSTLGSTVTRGTSITSMTGTNTGTMVGNVAYTYTKGGALTFTGNTASIAYVQLPAGHADYTKGITMQVAGSMDFAGGNWVRFIDFGNGAGSNNFIMYRNSGDTRLAVDIYGTTYLNTISPAGALISNEDAIWCFTYDGYQLQLYKNGTLSSASIGTMTIPIVTRNNCYIGRSNWPDPYLRGNIYDVKIYNRALSAAEVAINAAALRGRFAI